MTKRMENCKSLEPKVLRNTIKTKYSKMPMINYFKNKNNTIIGYFNWDKVLVESSSDTMANGISVVYNQEILYDN